MLQDFEYHWKHVKNFYAANQTVPRMHINNTNLPLHLEKMLELLISEESQCKKTSETETVTDAPSAPTLSHIKLIDTDPNNECFQFVVSNRPLDLLADICITDAPPGTTVCILNWMRRFLSCLQRPHLEHKSVYEPILKLVASLKDTAGKASPYELEEIMFLLTVAGVVRKDPILLNLFLPRHLVTMNHTVIVATVTPTHNSLFDGVVTKSAPLVELVEAPDNADTSDGMDVVDKALQSLQMCLTPGDTVTNIDSEVAAETTDDRLLCDCRKSDSLALFDTIVHYFDSAVSVGSSSIECWPHSDCMWCRFVVHRIVWWWFVPAKQP